MYYIKYNEIDLTELVKVRDIEIPSLPSIKHSSIDMFERDGEVYNGASYGTREIKLTFIIKPDNKKDYEQYVRDVKRAFYTKEECRLFCGDEKLYIWCVPEGEMVITELGSYCAEAEVNLIAYDPYWHSTDQQAVNNGNNKKFTVENESDTNVYPVIQIGFTKDTTFCQIENQTTEERILVGGIPTTEGTTIKRDTKVFEDNMESTSGWSSTTAPIDSSRATGGTLSITSDGAGVMCGNFGSTSSGAIWHGACYKKSLDTPVKDFKVKIKMRHNSTGTNGDPSYPYQNDTEDIISGGISTHYEVSCPWGVILRKLPTETAEKILIIPYGAKLAISAVANGYLETTYDGKVGYCSLYSLRQITSDTRTTIDQRNYVATTSTAIRANASKDATNKKTIPAGTCIRCMYDAEYPSWDTEDKFYKLAKAYDGVTGYVLIADLVEADNYKVEYVDDVETADDKTGVVELYGFSANNVQLFKLSMVDDNEWYEHTYPLIKKNGEEFLKDTSIPPQPKTKTSNSDNSNKVEKILSGKYGDWNEFYGELYIERVNNMWSAYVQKINEGQVVKVLESRAIIDAKNKDEKLNYIVIYFGTTGDASKASGMAITDINVYAGSEIDNTVTYNFQEFEKGDILTIDNSIPAVYLNNRKHNELIDIGSQFFSLRQGENEIKVASDDTPNVDVLWNNKYL